MASALGIPTSDSNGGTFSRGYGKPNFTACFVGFHTLDAGADLVRFAPVVQALIVEELYVFQMVRPYGEGSGSNGFSIVAFPPRSTDVEPPLHEYQHILTHDRYSVSQAGCYVVLRTRSLW